MIGPLVLVVVLLILNGYFVAVEFAYTAASRNNLTAQPGRAARWAIAAIDDLSFTLAGAQLGITIASLALGAVAEPSIAAVLELVVGGLIDIDESMLHVISLIISLVIVLFLHMVIGEMAPKNLAIASPDRMALLFSYPNRVYTFVFKPVILFLNGIANLGMRLFGFDPDEIGSEAHTADDLAAMISTGREGGVIEEFTHRLLTGAIDLTELDANDVMVPRPDVIALPANATAAQFEEMVISSGLSRIPTYEEDRDDLTGFVHAKDLLRIEDAQRDHPLPSSLVRPLLAVPESSGVQQLLAKMRREHNHIAVVVDEHGATAGIVTLEDIAEEVVGEITDEHDPTGPQARRIDPDRYLVSARLRPDEASRRLGVDIPEGEYETVGGLVMERLGRVPRTDDVVEEQDWTMRVRRMDGRRVIDVVVTTHPVSDDESEV